MEINLIRYHWLPTQCKGRPDDVQSRKQRRPHPLTRFVRDEEVLGNFECHMLPQARPITAASASRVLAVRGGCSWKQPGLRRGRLVRCGHSSYASDRVAASTSLRSPPRESSLLSLSETHTRIYWWCSPPRIDTANVSPTVWTARGIGASLCSDKCVQASL
jgi:hypothetical protein